MLAFLALCRATRRPVPRTFFARFLASLICLRDDSFFSFNPACCMREGKGQDKPRLPTTRCMKEGGFGGELSRVWLYR